jgi:transposase
MPVSTPGCGSGELIESIICLRDVTHGTPVQVAVIEACCDVCCTAVVAGARVRTRCCSGQDAAPRRSAHPRLSAGGSDTPMTQRAAASEADTSTSPMATVDVGNDVYGFLLKNC